MPPYVNLYPINFFVGSCEDDEKIMEFEKKRLNYHGKIIEFCGIIWGNHL